jgi:hypothetical protein
MWCARCSDILHYAIDCDCRADELAKVLQQVESGGLYPQRQATL